MAIESVPGTLPHESPTFGLDESRVTMTDSAGMFEHLAALFDEIGENTATTKHMRHLAMLGAYYAREQAAGQEAGREVSSDDLIDCASVLGGASVAFGHLDSLFQVIEEKVGNRTRMKSLAEVGQYTASDFANTLDVARERAEAAAKEAA